jgi:hypothetical protein
VLCLKKLLTIRLIAIMLGRLRMSVDDCLNEYYNVGGDIFGHPRRAFHMRSPLFFPFRHKYPGKLVEETVKKVIAHNSKNIVGNERSEMFPGREEMCRV